MYGLSHDTPGSNPIVGDQFGGDVMVLELEPLANGRLGTTAYNPFTNWNGTVLLDASPAISWDNTAQQISITEPGLYEVDFQASLEDNDRINFNEGTMNGAVMYGTEVVGALNMSQSLHFTGQSNGSNGLPASKVTWSDHYTIVLAEEDLPMTFQPKVYGGQYQSGTGDSIAVHGIVTITKIA